jgi:hypothetical protein
LTDYLFSGYCQVFDELSLADIERYRPVGDAARGPIAPHQSGGTNRRVGFWRRPASASSSGGL